MIHHPAPTTAAHARAEEPPVRRLSPSATPSGGLAAMLLEQSRAEFMKLWRVPSFTVSTVVFPLILFLLFGAPNAHFTGPDGVNVGKFLLASFSAYGLIGMAMFGFGVGVATERGQGWMRLVRATPMPAWVYFAGKIVMSTLFSFLILGLLFSVSALAVGIRMPASQWVGLGLTLLFGALPFSTLGFAFGYLAGPNSASPIANLIYLPLSFASGLFIPLWQLPRLVQDIAPYLPTYHYGKLAWHAVGATADEPWVHVAWILGTAVVFGALAVWGYRRDQSKGFG